MNLRFHAYEPTAAFILRYQSRSNAPGKASYRFRPRAGMLMMLILGSRRLANLFLESARAKSFGCQRFAIDDITACTGARRGHQIGFKPFENRAGVGFAFSS